MKSFFTFVVSRLVAGVLFIAPVLIVILVLREILRFTEKLLRPIATHLPAWVTDSPGGGYMMAAVTLVTVAFLVGLFALTNAGRRFTQTLERLVLGKIPGFTLFRSLILGLVGQDSDDDVKVVLVTLDEAWLFGFLMERHADGMLTVFVPSAPTPTSGSLYFFREDQVRHTQLKVGEAMRSLARLGVGSPAVFNDRLREIIEHPAPPPE